jgi:hypothetical protein
MPRTSYESQLLAAARRVGRLEGRARRLRAEVKQTEAELRHERKMLRALAASTPDVERRPDAPPLRIFGEEAAR